MTTPSRVQVAEIDNGTSMSRSVVSERQSPSVSL
jgi:hypothetical protein